MSLHPNVLLTKWYVLDRCTTGGTTGGTGYLEVFAPDAATAVEKARAYPWPVGSEIGAALAPDVFRVESWHRIGLDPVEAAELHHARITGTDTSEYPVCVKADGLLGGKCVVVCQTAEEVDAALRTVQAEEPHFRATIVVVLTANNLKAASATFLAMTDALEALGARIEGGSIDQMPSASNSPPVLPEETP